MTKKNTDETLSRDQDRGPGRPPVSPDGAREKWVQVRVTEAELQRYKAAAAARGLNVAEWVRQLCKRSAAQV